LTGDRFNRVLGTSNFGPHACAAHHRESVQVVLTVIFNCVPAPDNFTRQTSMLLDDAFADMQRNVALAPVLISTDRALWVVYDVPDPDPSSYGESQPTPLCGGP